MNKFLVLMVSLTLLLWGTFLWNMSEKVNSSGPSIDESSLSVPEKKLDLRNLQVLLCSQPKPAKDMRNPFALPTVFSPTPKIVRARPRKEVVEESKPVVSHPNIALDVVLPGDNPVAILKYHGESAVVSAGQEIWGVVVRSIGNDHVVLQDVFGSFEIR